MTMVAPKRMLLAMSPWLRMPPSAMMGLVATRAHHFSALQLPAAGAKAGLELGDADLARADADLGGVRTPVFQVDHRLGCGHVAGDHEAAGQLVS